MMSPRHGPARSTFQLVAGLGLIALGFLLILDRIGLADADRAIRFWPLLLVGIGVSKLLDAPRRGAWLAGTVWTFAGLWQLAHNLRWVEASVFDLWPLLLVLLGARLLSRTLPAAAAGDTADRVSRVAVLHGARVVNTSRSFRGGDLTALLGGCELDLRGATLAPEGATLDLFALWGGIELRIPPHWTLVSHVVPILGGSRDATARDGADPSRQLVLRGYAIMGGVEVHN